MDFNGNPLLNSYLQSLDRHTEPDWFFESISEAFIMLYLGTFDARHVCKSHQLLEI